MHPDCYLVWGYLQQKLSSASSEQFCLAWALTTVGGHKNELAKDSKHTVVVMRRGFGAAWLYWSYLATRFSQRHQLWQLRTDFLLGTKWCFGRDCAPCLVLGTMVKVSICSSHLSRQLWGWDIAVPGYWCPTASCSVDLEWYEMHFIIYGGLCL